MLESLSKSTGDKTVAPGQKVILEAAAIEVESEHLRYEWRQVFGPKVRLMNQYSNTPYFMAPETQELTKIFFEVTVSDGLDIHSDEIMILVDGAGETELVSLMQDDPDSVGFSLADCFAAAKGSAEQ